jgi:EAL domain-containing protein (putative c-di-GMP-specific phosphodiesterase class I)
MQTTHRDCHITPGRIGGDEFVLLVQYGGDQQRILEIASKMLAEIRKPYKLSGRECHTTTSIGITFGEFDYDDPLDVLRDADAAMYRAKSDGKDQFICFDQAVHDAYMDRLVIEEELRTAVEDQSTTLHYQPIVDLHDGRVLGFEALVRWHHARLGNITPVRFIPIAEETGLIIPLGKQIFTMAVKQLVAWQKQFGKPLTMNINLSKRQIIEPDLINWIAHLIKEYKPIPGTVKVEVTESVIMDAPDMIAPTLHQLRKLNIPICMDDFGTGHSSLHCLSRFPIDVLKIDRAFISNMSQQRGYSAVVFAILTLAQNMNVQVVAEGLETESQLAQLQALDCDAAQGWYFARDLNVMDATALLEKGGSMAVDLNQIRRTG